MKRFVVRVKIYVPVNSPMQSGKFRRNKWVLEHCPQNSRFIEPLMGWTGNSDPNSQVKLSFKSKKDAISYAQRKNLSYDVCG